MQDESQLEILSSKLALSGASVTEFYEPDLGNQLTAIAFISDASTKKLTSGLPLLHKQINKL